jgi:hypothetical protein
MFAISPLPVCSELVPLSSWFGVAMKSACE